MDYATLWLLLKGGLALLFGTLFTIGCNRFEKWLERLDAKKDELDREARAEQQKHDDKVAELQKTIDDLRDELKRYWDDGHSKDLNHIRMIGVIAVMVTKSRDLINRVENGRDYEHELKQLKEITQKVENMRELRIE